MPDDEVLVHATYIVPDSFNWTKRVQQVQFMETQIQHSYWYSGTVFVLLAICELVFAHLMSFTPLFGSYPLLSFLVLLRASVRKCRVTVKAMQFVCMCFNGMYVNLQNCLLF